MSAAPATARPPLVSGRVVWFLLSSFTGMGSFYLLMSVLPLEASAHGAGAAGLVTGITMAACVACELLFAARLDRLGPAGTMVLGNALLAGPDAVLAMGSALPLLLALSVVRGAGLAIVVVAGTGIAADVAPPGRRGEMLGVYGFAVSVPGAIGLPAGVWLAHTVGFPPVFLLAAALGAAATGLAVLTPGRRRRRDDAPVTFGLLAKARTRRPALVFLTTTIALGVYTSFLPVAMLRTPATLVSLALLAESVASATVRWVAGRLGDRVGPGPLLVPAILVGAAGGALIIAVGVPAAVVAGMLLYGVGFGALQNLTLTLMYEAAGERGFGGVGAIWNAAYDGGVGGGALGFGFLSGVTGYPGGFAATAAVLALGLVPALRDRFDHRRDHRKVGGAPTDR